MTWKIHISRINTSDEDAYKFAKMINDISEIEIDLSGNSYEGNLNDCRYTGYVIIICRFKSSDENILVRTCKKILNLIPGNVKIMAFSYDDSQSLTLRKRKEYFFSKFNSLSGISFCLIDGIKDKLQLIFRYLDDALAGHYFTVYFDECYVNVIANLDTYCLEDPIFLEDPSLTWEIFPWLESDGSQLNFPHVDDGLRWKVVPAKDENNWDVSGDDLSLDSRFW